MEALASGRCVAPSPSLERENRSRDHVDIGHVDRSRDHVEFRHVEFGHVDLGHGDFEHGEAEQGEVEHLAAFELDPDADGVRRSAAHCAWTGLEDLRAEVRAAIARHCRQRHVDADDVVQEALMRAARYRHSLTDPERLRAWVVRIGLNVLRDQMRRDLRLPRVERGDELFDLLEGREEIPGEPPEDELEAEGEVFERGTVMRQLDRALEELPRGDRRVLDAYYQRGDPSRRASCVRESGAELIKVRVFRARSKLARMLRKRLALGLCGDSLSRPSSIATHDFRSARCAPVRRTESKRGIAAGNPS